MPEQSYPPYAAGALTSPRQLNRWLDVNPQNGALQRTRGYIVLPTFNQAVTWRGYSEIMATWNFASSNSFTLKDITALPTSGNYVLCIAYQLAGVVYRYKLCGPDGVFYEALVDYDGQLIKNNFRFEVWSVADAAVSETTAHTLYTSKRGNQDYSQGVDFQLVANDGLISDFQSIDTAVDVPYLTDVLFHFRADSNYDRVAGTWDSVTADANQLTCVAPGQLPATSSLINNQTYITITQTKPWVCVLNNPAECFNVFVIFRAELTASSGSVIKLTLTGGIVYNIKLSASVAPSSTSTTTITPENDGGDYTTIVTKLSNDFYMVEIRSQYCFHYDLDGSSATAQGTGTLNANSIVDQLDVCADRGLDLVEILAYAGQQNFVTAPDYYQLFKYVSDRYGIGRIPLPFTFPTDAEVPTN